MVVPVPVRGDDGDYVCSFCERGQCGRCREVRCTCCQGGTEDE